MLIYGHRGAAGEAPENTLGGFRHAWERGARCLELDVRLSADEELVVVHDPKVDRTTNGRGAVSAFTSEELARLDARRKGPPWPQPEGIPRLAEVLRALPRTESWLVEVKKASSETQRRLIARRLRELLARSRIRDRIVVTSGDREFLAILREVLPNVARGYVGVDMDPLKIALEHGCTHVLVNQFACTPALRLQAWRRRLVVVVWTVNDPVVIRHLHRMRVHGVVTDYPSMAVPLLGQIAGPGRLAPLGTRAANRE